MNDTASGDRWDWEYTTRDLTSRPPLPIVQSVIDHSTAKDRILYIGIGDARNFRHLMKAGLDIHGCDPSKVAIDQMADHATPTDRVLHGSFEELFTKAESFDVIVASRVLICGDLEASGSLLRSAYALLRPGGRIIIEWTAIGTDPWPLWSQAELDPSGNLHLRYANERVEKVYLSFDGCIELLEGSGFELDRGPAPIDLPRGHYPGGIVRDWIAIARKPVVPDAFADVVRS